MSNPPAFSHKAMVAKAVLYSPYNSFTLFVEDKSLEHMYLTIMKKMFPNLSLRRVFPLGGKGFVNTVFFSYRKGEIEIPGHCFFLSDLDLEPYLGVDLIKDDIFVYLEEYCIENYFIDEEALTQALQWKLHAIPEDIKSSMKYNDWLDSVVRAFFRLHLGFVLCRKFSLGENVQLSPYIFIEERGYSPDNFKIDEYINELKHKFCQKGLGTEKDFEEELIQISKTIYEITKENIKSCISGKFLLASLYRYACNVCGQKMDYDLLLGLLVEHFDVDRLGFVRERILMKIS